MVGSNARPLRIGLYIPVGERMMEGGTARWSDLQEMAQLAEQIGFDSVWIPDHLIFQMEPGLPEGWWECGAMLGALAASTTDIVIGTIVFCTSFRNPALLAKIADTVDEISDGRFILGLGAGYHDPEYEAFGYPITYRYSRFQEAIQIIHGLLKNGFVDFDGRFYQARECELRPRGPSAGGPPILIGTTGHKMLRLAAQYADIWNGWLVNEMSSPDDLRRVKPLVDEACDEAERDPATLGRTVGIFMSPTGIRKAHVSRLGPPLTGSPEELADVLRQFAEEGISEVQVWVYPNSVTGIEAFAPILQELDRS